MKTTPFVAEMFGSILNRLQLAGGWIDQPFVSKLNPKPPGAMVVMQIEPNFRPMRHQGLDKRKNTGGLAGFIAIVNGLFVPLPVLLQLVPMPALFV
jgi:hypothetical protein